MPRFSIKDLLWAITMVAVGIGAALLGKDLANSPDFPGALLMLVELGLWLGGNSLAGAGVLYLFGRAWLGGIAGCLLAALVLIFEILSGV